jgi:von Willebrand factor type A domain
MRLPRSRRTAVASREGTSATVARRRTFAVRLGLVVASVALLAAAADSARGLDVRERGFLPRGSTGVVVLDLSLSISERSYPDVRRAVRRLIRADAPVGLVVFSDAPYELLPPGTPASELKPLLRLLEPPKGGVPANPWWQTFRAGTRISSALDLARSMLERDRVRDGYVVLVSDLATAPDDVEPLTRTVRMFQQDGIDMRIVPLSPSSDGLELFEGLLGKKAFATLPAENGQAERVLSVGATSPVPTMLLMLGGLLFAALALHERYAGRLALPRGRRTGKAQA